jgi:hypothetical protein
MINLS